MENKSPYVLIGAAMILFLASVVGFVIWKLREGDQTSYAYYDILFSGDVQGLTVDSPVYYRGLRVGRVQNIELTSRRDVQRSTGRERLAEKIEVTVAVDSHIDIRERSYAVFEKPFIAGAAFIQIVGRLEVDEIKPKKKVNEKPYPEIREGASFIEATSTSAQELLSKAGTTVDRLNELLSEDNLTSFSEAMRNVSTLTGSFAKQDKAIQSALAELPAAISDFHKTFDKLNKLSDEVGLIAMEIGPQDAETRKALTNINGAAGQLNKLISSSREPIQRFSETGLTELSLAIHELRELTANLNIIATKLERDPAGFVFSGKQGYTPK